MLYSSLNWRMVHFFPLRWYMVTPKAFHVIRCTALIYVPVLKIPSWRNGLGASWLEHANSGVQISEEELYATLPSARCLFLICITSLKIFPFSQDKVTLVCGSDGIAAQMGFLVIITEGTSVPSTQGMRTIRGWSLIQAW